MVNKENKAEYNLKYKATMMGRIRTLLARAKHAAKHRGHEFTLTPVKLLDIWLTQNGRCYYSGLPMNFTTKHPHLVSVERLDNSLGYVDGNVVLACWCVNRARNILTKDQLLEMCKAIVEHQGSNMVFQTGEA